MNAKVFQASWDVSNRLEAIGLSLSELEHAVARGYVARNTCTLNHPKFVPGLWAWAEMVATLREVLVPKQWTKVEIHNYPLVVNPTGTIAIAVATGDEATGLLDGTPCNKASKGPATADAVALNHLQYELFKDLLPPKNIPTESISRTDRLTWVLLVHFADTGVRSELSLPWSMTNDGRIASWHQRILLPTLSTEPLTYNEEAPESSPDIEIPVRRRT